MTNTKAVQKSFSFSKECGWPYDLCGEANNVGWVNCMCIICDRAIIFSHIIRQYLLLIISIKFLIKLKIFDRMNCMHTI